MSEEKKSCKEQANEVLLRALKTHAFACEHERLNKKDAEIMAILAGAITNPDLDFAGLMALVSQPKQDKTDNLNFDFAKAREAAGLTVAEAARRLSITSSAICQWENGTTFPDAKRLVEIAKVYGTTVDELLREES